MVERIKVPLTQVFRLFTLVLPTRNCNLPLSFFGPTTPSDPDIQVLGKRTPDVRLQAGIALARLSV